MLKIFFPREAKGRLLLLPTELFLPRQQFHAGYFWLKAFPFHFYFYFLILQCNLFIKSFFLWRLKQKKISIQSESPIFILSFLFKPHSIIIKRLTWHGAELRDRKNSKASVMFGTNLAYLQCQLSNCRRCYFRTSNQLSISPLHLIFIERTIIKVSMPIAEQKLVGLSLDKENHHNCTMVNSSEKA